MSIDFGRLYVDNSGTVHKCIGRAVSFSGDGGSEILFAPIHAGCVGDVLYVKETEVEDNLMPLSNV